MIMQSSQRNETSARNGSATGSMAAGPDGELEMNVNETPPTRSGCYFFWNGFLSDEVAERLLAPPQVEAQRRRASSKPGDLPSYFAHLYATPLLVAQEEQHYFQRFNYLKFCEATLVDQLEEPPRAAGSRQELAANRLELEEELEGIRSAIERTRNLLVESNLRLVVALAKRYSESTAIELDEFVAIGNTALMRSVELFDFRRGLRFSTYAYQAVGRAMLTLLKKHRRYQQTFASVGEGFAELAEQEHVDSLDAEREAAEALESAKLLISELESRDQFIVKSRFGIERDHNGQSFSRIAKDVGLSTTRTVQLFNRSMEKLRRVAEGLGLTDEVEQLDAVA